MDYTAHNEEVFTGLIRRITLITPDLAQAASTAVKEYLVPLRQAGLAANGSGAYPSKKDGEPSYLFDTGNLSNKLDNLDNISNQKVSSNSNGFELELSIEVKNDKGTDYGAIQQEDKNRVWFDINTYEAKEKVYEAMRKELNKINNNYFIE